MTHLRRLRRGSSAVPHSKLTPAKIATIIIMTIMCGVFLLDIMTVLLFNHYEKRYPVEKESFSFLARSGESRIHFLDTGNSDAALLESDGHFALIDSGWGSDNPNAKARRPGYEDQVLAYLKKVAADADGVVRLDFILATHYHYDHAGGFAGILADPVIEADVAYLRAPEHLAGKVKYLAEISEQVFSAARSRGIPIADPPAGPFLLGAMEIRFFNLNRYEKNENDNSIVTLVRVNGATALLTADITNLRGLEGRLGREIGQVDLMTLCHHGYALSNAMPLLRAAQPKLAIVNNDLGKVYPNVKWNLVMGARAPYYSTVREGGIIVHFGEDGEIRLTGGLE